VLPGAGFEACVLVVRAGEWSATYEVLRMALNSDLQNEFGPFCVFILLFLMSVLFS
jgi:hypothetical protein